MATAQYYKSQGYEAYQWNSTLNRWEWIDDTTVFIEGVIFIDNVQKKIAFVDGSIIGTGTPGFTRAVIADTANVNVSIDLVIDSLTIKNYVHYIDCGVAIRTQNDTWSSQPHITANNCIISNNISAQVGGVIDNVGGIIDLNNCTIKGNKNTSSDPVTQFGAAISNRYNVCTVNINGCYFYNNYAAQAGGALYNENRTAVGESRTPNATATVANSCFLTGGDNIFCASGTITFSGTNYLAASVTKMPIDGAKNVLEDGAGFTFINHAEPITIQCTLEGNNTFTFNNGGLNGSDNVGYVDFSGTTLSNDITVVINPSGKAGDMEMIATGITTWDENKEVKYNGEGPTAIKNISGVSLSAGTLKATVTAKGLIMNTTVGNAETTFIGKNVEFTSTDNPPVYTEVLGTVTAGGDKVITGNGTSVTILENGKLYADGNELTISKLQYSGRINGDNVYSANSDTKAVNLTLGTDAEAMKIVAGTKASRIYGGADITAQCTLTGGENITLNIHLTDDSVVGNVYGGGCLSIANSSYTIGTINTTIDGGTYQNYVGNGTQANTGCTVTQGASTLTIKSGTFNNFVYAGGYCQAANTVSVGATKLNISGGTFNSKVLGGCAASSNNAFTSGTTVAGTSILVDTTTNAVAFYDNLVAGSSGKGSIDGDTTITFTGSGSNLTFNSSAAGKGYVQGGSTGDRASESSADGNDRELAFDNFSGKFGANARNSFDTVTFTGSSVTFTGATEVDLRYVKNWGFDITDDEIDLTWENNVSGRTANDFTHDILNISGTLSSDSKVLMAGDDTTLKNWDKIDSLKFGETSYANKGYVELGSYVNFGDTYKLSVVDNQLTLGTLV